MAVTSFLTEEAVFTGFEVVAVGRPNCQARASEEHTHFLRAHFLTCVHVRAQGEKKKMWLARGPWQAAACSSSGAACPQTAGSSCPPSACPSLQAQALRGSDRPPSGLRPPRRGPAEFPMSRSA